MSNPMRALPSPLRWFGAICLGITAFSWCFAAIYFRHTHLEWASVWSHDPSDAFGDFTHYAPLFQFFHTREFFLSDDRFAYPAPAAVLFSWLYRMGPYQLQIFLAGIVVSAVAACWLFCKSLIRAGLATAPAMVFTGGVLITSWPLLFLYERANIEVIVWLLASLGIWALLRDRPVAAAVLFGLCGSLKLYPILLLALLFSRRHLREFFLGVATFAAAMLAAFWFVGPTMNVAFHGTLNGISGFVGNYAATAHDELQFDHSFLGGIKMLLTQRPFHMGNFAGLTTIYIAIAGIGAALLFLLRVRRLPLINRILFVCICMVGLPPVSYDYTLIHLCVPFALFTLAEVSVTRSGDRQPGTILALICFGVLFTPQLFLFYGPIHLNGLLKTAALVTLAVLLSLNPIIELDQPALVEEADEVDAAFA